MMKLTIALIVTTFMFGTAADAQSSHREWTDGYPRQFGYVTMKDGVKLAYVAYLPQAKGRFPTVLQYEPYWGATSGPWWPGAWQVARMWLKNGYAVVFASVRGTGCSQGVFNFFFEPQQGPDGAALIDWIATQSWSDRRVGMIGVSYPGHTQILVAAQHPKFLKAIEAASITSNIYREAFYPGGIFNVAFVAEWSLHAQPWLEGMGIKERISWGDDECESNYRAHPPSELFQQARAHPFLDEWWRTRSLESYIERVEVPAFIAGNWQDQQTVATGTTELYERLKGPKRLSIAPGGHGGTEKLDANQQDRIRWMDRWVKGVRNGIEAEPPVTIYWEPSGSKPVPGWTTHYESWPPKATELRSFWLTSEGTLSAAAPDGSPAETKGLSYTFPTGVELVGDNTQFAIAPDPNGSLTWTTAPLDVELTILGSVQVKFYAASENTDTDFDVTLHDVYPDGSVQYLQRGFLRASLRALDQEASSSDQLAHPYDKPEYLVPGRTYEIRFSLPPLGAVLRKGHRLQMVVLSPSPIPQPNWGLLPLSMPGVNTVYVSAKYPSEIIVPVMHGIEAGAPEPACGSMAFQPCRPPKRP
jgi:uncharacterized protein